jgi:hypothetical protein
MREKVLIDYDLTERDMREIVTMLKRDDPDAACERLQQRYSEPEAEQQANKRPAGSHGRGRPLDVHNNENGVNIYGRPWGNSAAAALRRLDKDRPDLHKRVLAGEMSANAAMVEASFRKKPKRKPAWSCTTKSTVYKTTRRPPPATPLPPHCVGSTRTAPTFTLASWPARCPPMPRWSRPNSARSRSGFLRG